MYVVFGGTGVFNQLQEDEDSVLTGTAPFSERREYESTGLAFLNHFNGNPYTNRVSRLQITDLVVDVAHNRKGHHRFVGALLVVWRN